MRHERLLERVRRTLTAQRALLHRDPTLPPRLRRDPVALARLLAAVPPDLLAIDCEVWAEAARVLAKVSPSGRSAGSALYATELSELRLVRLLRGGFAVREGGRWLAAKEAEHADLAQLVVLDLYRAMPDHEGIRSIADDIALDYARAARRVRRYSQQIAAT